MNRVILKKGKERALKFRHPWIFSGAIKEISPCEDGIDLPVYSEGGELLGHGYVNRKSDITVRMLSFDDTPCEKAIEENLKEALKLREELFKGKETNAYRVINSEGDGIPGLIIDRFNEVIVIQIGTLGIRKLKKTIIDLIIKLIKPKAIVEKSNLPSLKKEGLKSEEGLLYGEWDEELVIRENGLSFKVDIQKGQKTGFFLDHREMRNKILDLSKGKTVLNAFCYSGAFSVYALKGGALKVDSLDISKEAIGLAKENVALNGFSNKENEFIAEDVFTFLREKPLDYDIVILDPPAFAKTRKDVDAACRGYKDINRLAFSKVKKAAILLTCSCSYHVNTDLFQQVIFQAALEAKKKVRIIGRHELAKDHPISIYHPEGDYLKSLLLYVS